MRQELVPLPNIVFIHPFIGKTIILKVTNLSGTGFSVEEHEEHAVLLPGMILPELELIFAESFRIKCKVQVVYGNSWHEGEVKGLVKSGLAILDMNIGDHLRLLSMLEATDKNSFNCSNVDMDALWNFFFETGFIYPEKYSFFQAHKESIKKTYDLLYNKNPHIARHFIYQAKGTILGHLAMVRFYENSWLIHHHAATRSGLTNAGLYVLNQVGHFINNSHNLYSAHMNFVCCYYRPQNKFPDRVFGGLARQLKDPKGCSLDTFAYFHFNRSEYIKTDIPIMWELMRSQPEDLEELAMFYEHESGGLMLDALELKQKPALTDRLVQEYQSLGFKKEKHLLSLAKDGKLMAVFLVIVSDIGLNMSNLTNCVKVIVMDDTLPVDILNGMLSFMSSKYEDNSMPVLMYPVSYAEKCSYSIDKYYNFWVLSMRNTDQYFEYLENMIKSIRY